MTQTILAIDASLSNTAVLYGHATDYAIKTFGSENVGNGVLGRITRYQQFIEDIMGWIGEQPPTDAIYIEGYSLASVRPGNMQITEYGGLLRWHLLKLTERIYEVAPLTLKKFVTGKGAGKKLAVISVLSRKYGVTFDTDDEFDAFGIYRLALVAEGLVEADNQAQREAANTVLGIKNEKPKKKKQLTSE